MTPSRHVGAVARGRVLGIRIGDWPSGLYFARLLGAAGKVGYAPFVLRPKQLGITARVAVVFSTMTWQAYNFHDDDRNGTLDTWYAGAAHARLGRPFENRGVIPHYKHYEHRSSAGSSQQTATSTTSPTQIWTAAPSPGEGLRSAIA